jgi:hypothetical protein
MQALGNGLDDQRLEPRQGQEIFFLVSEIRPDLLLSSPRLLFRGYVVRFSGVKSPGRDVKHSLISSTEFENEWSCTPAPPVCTNTVDKNICTPYQIKQQLLPKRT